MIEEKINEQHVQRNGLTVMARLIILVKPLTKYMCLAILLGLLGHLCASFITILGGYAVLEALQFDTPLSLPLIFFLVIAFAALRAGFRYGEQTCNHFIAFNLLAIIRDKVFRALRRLAPAKLEGRDKGDLIAVITSDIELLEVFYAHTISPIAIWILYTLCMVLFIGSYHILLGALALIAYGITGILIPLVISQVSGDAGIKFRTKAGDMSAFVLDSLRGLSEIQQYGAGEHRLEEINNRSDALSEEEGRMKAMAGRNAAITNSVILIFDLIMLFVSLAMHLQGEITASAAVICTIAQFASFGPSVALAALGSTLQNTFAAGNRVLDILDEEPVTREIKGRIETEFHGASVQGLNFTYDEETILTDVNIEFPKTRIIGITGRSGSGKSTLLKLLMRFWQADSGEIRISGESIENINTRNLRDMESYVTQETQLFHDSIRNNIRIADLDATDEEIEQACRKAAVHDFIMSLPQGYDTPVGELGETLSGGERQRIGLARAFLHDAPFLLLDEPTSNLDSLNEAVILRSLKEEQGEKTVVLVSHRQSTMRIADEVYSVENGRLS